MGLGLIVGIEDIDKEWLISKWRRACWSQVEIS